MERCDVVFIRDAERGPAHNRDRVLGFDLVVFALAEYFLDARPRCAGAEEAAYMRAGAVILLKCQFRVVVKEGRRAVRHLKEPAAGVRSRERIAHVGRGTAPYCLRLRTARCDESHIRSKRGGERGRGGDGWLCGRFLSL